MKMKSGLVLAALAAFLSITAKVEAVPAYARTHQLECKQCHSAWPLLNKFGRTFKENGYKLDRTRTPPPATATSGATPNGGTGNGTDGDGNETVISDTLSLARTLPISFRIQGRPFVKLNTNKRFNMQVVHEFELQVTDSSAHNYSFFVNIESADDADWAAEMKDLVGGWHPKAQANVVAGYGSLTFADPYNTFSNRRLTQDRPSPNGAGFQSSYRFRDATPFATFYGRAGGLFYSASAGTGRDDFVGADKKDYFVRAAYDLPGGLSVGTFALNGDRALTGPERTQEYKRAGVDVQIDSHGFTANALWYKANEDHATTLVDNRNKAWYIQTLYATPTKIPVVPVLRYESVESNNGAAATNSVALALVTYVRANLNFSLDFIKQVKVPGTAAKTNRFSILFMVGM